jgi:thioesterase domain-containing protein/acyl carrier protein
LSNTFDEIAKLTPEERALLEKMMKEEGVDLSGLPMYRVSRETDHPLSYSQERLWSLWNLAPGNPSENVYAAFEIRGRLNLSALQKAADEMIKRNEIFRTECLQKEDAIYQRILPRLKVKVEEYDFTDFEPDERKVEANKFIEKEISIPFNLTKAPLFRIIFLKLDTDHSVITIFTHQFVSDGYTANLIFQTLSDYYNEFNAGRKIPEISQQLDYIDFSAWQKRRIEGNFGEKQVNYWKEKIKQMPVQLKLTFNQLNNVSFRAETISFTLPAGLSNRLRSFGEKEGYSLFMILLAGLQLTLHELTHQEKILVTTSVSTRGASETEKMFGNFSNNLLFCSSIKNEFNLKEILNSIRKDVGQAFDYQDLPLEYLLQRLQKENLALTIPRIQVLFMMRDKNSEDLFRPEGVQVSKFPVDFPFSKLDMLFDIFTSKEEIKINFTYKSELFEAELITEFNHIFTEVLDLISTKVNAKISELPNFRTINNYPKVTVQKKEKTEYAAPRSATEKSMVEIWEKYFNKKPIGITDNFFDLGGHSLLALTIFNQMEKIFGKKLPLATLFKHQTIEKLAAITDNVFLSADWSSIVPINTKGSKIPFYCIHGAGGNVLLYKDLSARLGEDQPFYGIQSKGLDGSGKFHTSIEEMAGYYLKELLEIQPDGPYLLGGYCMGGTIAYEMAQQLIKKGKKVGLIALLDTYNFNITSRKDTLLGNASYYFQNTFFHIKNILRVPFKEKIIFIKEKIKIARERTEEKLYQLRKGIYKNLSSSDLENSQISLEKMNDSAALKYEPKPINGNVAIFKPEAMFTNFNDPTLGWGNLVKGEIKVIELPVFPKGMLVEPFVQVLAEKLKKEIENAAKEKV